MPLPRRRTMTGSAVALLDYDEHIVDWPFEPEP